MTPKSHLKTQKSRDTPFDRLKAMALGMFFDAAMPED